MVSTLTEIVCLVLKPGINITGSSDAAKTWDECVSLIQSQPGYIGSTYGPTMEDPLMYEWFIDWTSATSREAFGRSLDFMPFKTRLESFNASICCYHVPFNLAATIFTLNFPVVQLVTFFAVSPQMLSNVREFITAIGRSDQCYGGVCGESLESNIRWSGDGRRGTVVALLIGWESKESHTAFEETDVYKESIELLEEEGVAYKGQETVHVHFKMAIDFEGLI
ncbi:uncharacterized protein RSE6_07769 [Rhynchosporium secalis]|uniref:ABM domain-containing protein n=1 Tax=Rhynchosporium secalis TaxID=38038 RepID=A0A1E1MDP2_RHYSE|nr:uncharacterized protein RSE6_07769 [Rhynchosporium secalis]